MTDRYAFHINSAACSGCKTCQIACKDRNDLNQGQLWRRVYEIEGGEWHLEGDAWDKQPWSYFISMSCNHCSEPECVKACPTTAMHVNSNGIVLVDHEKCMGCGYCSWACPYGAPRPDPISGQMTKCNFCYDKISAGGIPSCVESCPMRALDFGTIEELKDRYGETRHIFPLPPEEMTEPNIVITPHRDSGRASDGKAMVVNREEV